MRNVNLAARLKLYLLGAYLGYEVARLTGDVGCSGSRRGFAVLAVLGLASAGSPCSAASRATTCARPSSPSASSIVAADLMPWMWTGATYQDRDARVDSTGR